MKFKRIAAVLTAAMLLSMTACNDREESSTNIVNINPSNSSQSYSKSSPSNVEYTEPENYVEYSEPEIYVEYSEPDDDIPEIPVIDPSVFNYVHDWHGGTVVTGYHGKSAEVWIPDYLEGLPVVGIQHFAPPNSTNITSIVIPSSVTEISSYAFYCLKGLEKVTIGNGLKRICFHAFDGCSSLESINIPDSVKYIQWFAFNGCTSLTSITIPDGVTEIDECVFFGCTSLADITIPNGVTEICDAAFYGCTSLTSITIPDSVTVINELAFLCCENIQATYKVKTYDYEHIDDLYKAINGE